ATSLIGSVAKAVLIPEFILNGLIDFLERLLVRNFEITAAGLRGNSFQDFLTIDVVSETAASARESRRHTPAPTAASPHAAATHSAAAHRRGDRALSVFAFEVNGVNQRVGTLGRLNRIADGFLAVHVDAIGDENRCLASLLRLIEVIRREIDSVVHEG